jgi:iron(III) transport system permease protein
VALAGAGLGVPVGTLVYWMHASHASTLPGASIWGALEHTASYSGAAALAATALALPVALLVVRFRSPAAVVLERSTYLVQSLPGLVIALALVYLANRYLHSFYQRSPLLVAAYTILFFPLALICVRASVAQAPRRLEEVGRSLGQPPYRVLLRVTLPLVAPGLAAAFCLVFLSAVTELTATLLLVPTGVQTLATQFWAYQSNTSYGAAAPYAVVMVALAAVPGYVLTRWFNRHPGEARP